MLPTLCLLVRMDLSLFWKSESHSGTRVPGRKRQPSKREFLRTRSALFLWNGCATGSKRQAWNPRKGRAHTKSTKGHEVVVAFNCCRCSFVTVVVVVREK